MSRFLPPNLRQTFRQHVWEIVRQIPAGKVASYGEIAARVPSLEGIDGDSLRAFGASWVGGAMAACPPDVPWQRVVNAQGKISLPKGRGYERQKALLEDEGIVFDERDRIDLKRFGW